MTDTSGHINFFTDLQKGVRKGVLASVVHIISSYTYMYMFIISDWLPFRPRPAKSL